MQKNPALYKKLKTEEHMLIRSDMYIGSSLQTNHKEWHLVNGKAVLRTTNFPYSGLHLVKEALSNVADNVESSRQVGIDPGECAMIVQGNYICISNGGIAMPVEIDPVSGMWIPDMCFSQANAGSNLGDTRLGGGANGIGAAAIGISSKRNGIEILNPSSGKFYKQEWANNMRYIPDPSFGFYPGTESLVKVWWIIDHERFGFPAGQFAYPEAVLQIFHWMCAALSFTSGIPVTFNGCRMHFDCRSYVELYVSDPMINSNSSAKSGGSGSSSRLENLIIIEQPGLKMILVDAPGDGKQVGFANHIINTEGGAHVQEVLKCVKDIVVTDKSKKSEVKITTKQIKPHVLVIISVTGIENPTWVNGQTKTSFGGPMPKLHLSDHDKKQILREWKVSRGVEDYINSRVYKDLGNTTESERIGKKIRTKKGHEAGWAGGKNSQYCTLIFLEGDSAEGYAVEAFEYMQGGAMANGTLVLMGKLLNVATASKKKIKENKEVIEIAKRLGAKPGIDYTLPKNRATLRYGRCMYMTDADEDGAHITSLLLTLFNELFPTLLLIDGFTVNWMTPYIRGKKGNQEVKFYYKKQYDDWLKANNGITDGWILKYYKGLGNSGKEEIASDYANKKEIIFEYDQRANSQLHLALGNDGKDSVAARREWMRRFNPDLVREIYNNRLPISQFIDDFQRPYSVHSLTRNIPAKDGMTHVQRQVVFGIFKTWGRLCRSKREINVPDFGGAVSALVHYHHGASILKSITNMGQTHVGSNNLPLLVGKGRFGTIDRGGKHAAQPRYLKVLPSPLLPLLMRPEDDMILEWSYEENKRVEPKRYLPILPIILFNGTKCVSTGSVSEIPNHHPLEIVDQFLDRLERGIEFSNLQPWYRGYQGDVYMDGNVLVSRGKAVINPDDNSVVVTCLPVGIWNRKYKTDFLDNEMFKKKTIKSYTSGCTANNTWFRVKGVVCNATNVTSAGSSMDTEITEERMQVIRRREMNNLTLIGDDGFPMIYRSAKHIMECFFSERLPKYDLRKQAIISQEERGLRILRERRAYIQAYLDRRFDFRSQNGESLDREDAIRRIVACGLNPLFYINKKKKKRAVGEEDDAEEDETDEDAGAGMGGAGIGANGAGSGPGYTVVSPHEMDRKGVEKLNKKEAEILEKIRQIKETRREDMWIKDLREFRAKYVTLNKNDERVYV